MKKTLFFTVIFGLFFFVNASLAEEIRIGPSWPCDYQNGVAQSECSFWFKIEPKSSIPKGTEPIFKNESLPDVPWAATYDWEILSHGDVAVEAPIRNGSISQWKLVKRDEDLIKTMFKISISSINPSRKKPNGEPADGTILKETFVENWSVADGNFYEALRVKDKIIYLYSD